MPKQPIQNIEDEPDLETRAKRYAGRGYVHFKKREMELARQNVRKSIELGMEESYVYSLLGSILSELGRLNDAYEVLRTAIAKHPNSESIVKKYALACLQTNNFDELEERMTSILANGNGQVKTAAYGALGEMNGDLENWDKAVYFLSMALDRKPCPYLYMMRSKAYEELGDHEKSNYDLNEMLKLDPKILED